MNHLTNKLPPSGASGPSVTLVESSAHFFACVHCGGSMKVVGNTTLQCATGHSFDISRHGHVNFISRAVKNDYNTHMLDSRRSVIKSGLFSPMLSHVEALLSGSVVLDAGCGEGSFLRLLLEHRPTAIGFGLDLSKDGIILGAKAYPQYAWVVGDLANLPFRPHSIDSIVNILSPANYDQFEKVLVEGGSLIKVLPNSDYLKEFRQFYYKGTPKESYSNQEVISLFKTRFSEYSETAVSYSFPLIDLLIEKIVTMSPLFWQKGSEKLPTVKDIPAVTMDFIVLHGKV